jgi:hypothetical protein
MDSINVPKALSVFYTVVGIGYTAFGGYMVGHGDVYGFLTLVGAVIFFSMAGYCYSRR